MTDDTEALRAEVAELRAEVERLRAWQEGHSCAPAWPANVTWPYQPPQPRITYGDPPSGWFPNACAAGAAGVPATLTFQGTIGGNYPEFHLDPSLLTTGCAAAPSTVVYDVPA